MMIGQHYLDDCLLQLRKLKTLPDKAIAQNRARTRWRISASCRSLRAYDRLP